MSVMSNLYGLPALPKSLSGFNVVGPNGLPNQYNRPDRSVYDDQRSDVGISKSMRSLIDSKFESKLAILKREMYDLRNLDMALLSQLWTLNESIQQVRQILQDQEDRCDLLSPPTPSPTPSSIEDNQGEHDENKFFHKTFSHMSNSDAAQQLYMSQSPEHRLSDQISLNQYLRTSNSSSATSSV